MDDDEFETASEISFQNRKKELGVLYREFRQALANMKALPEYSTDFNEPSEEEHFYRSELLESRQSEYELRGMLRELRSMRSETQELREMLTRVRSSKKQQVDATVAKVDSVLRIISGHIERVQNLLVKDPSY